MAGRGTGPDFVEALARGLDVLTCFDVDHRALSLTEVAAAAGLARPTARRLLLTLQELGYVRSVAVPVRDGRGVVRAAMNVTVHAAETSTERLLQEPLPRLLRAAGDVGAEWALWQSRPHVDVVPDRGGSATA